MRNMPDLFTRKTLIEHLLEHQRVYPDKDDYLIEVRDHLLVSPPQQLAHDDKEKVLILIGVGCR